ARPHCRTMHDEDRVDPLAASRRRFLRALGAVPFLLAGAGRRGLVSEAAAAEGLLAASRPARTDGADVPPTPECGDDDEPKPAKTPGPFFSPNRLRRPPHAEGGG